MAIIVFISARRLGQDRMPAQLTRVDAVDALGRLAVHCALARAFGEADFAERNLGPLFALLWPTEIEASRTTADSEPGWISSHAIRPSFGLVALRRNATLTGVATGEHLPKAADPIQGIGLEWWRVAVRATRR